MILKKTFHPSIVPCLLFCLSAVTIICSCFVISCDILPPCSLRHGLGWSHWLLANAPRGVPLSPFSNVLGLFCVSVDDTVRPVRDGHLTFFDRALTVYIFSEYANPNCKICPILLWLLFSQNKVTSDLFLESVISTGYILWNSIFIKVVTSAVWRLRVEAYGCAMA